MNDERPFAAYAFGDASGVSVDAARSLLMSLREDVCLALMSAGAPPKVLRTAIRDNAMADLHAARFVDATDDVDWNVEHIAALLSDLIAFDAIGMQKHADVPPSIVRAACIRLVDLLREHVTVAEAEWLAHGGEQRG